MKPANKNDEHFTISFLRPQNCSGFCLCGNGNLSTLNHLFKIDSWFALYQEEVNMNNT